jgi:hypothetical protein
MRIIMMNRTILAGLLALLLVPGCYLFQSSTSYYGIETAGKNVIFLLDISGSMEGKNEGSLSDRATGVAVEAGGDALGDAIGGPLGGMVAGQTKAEATKLGSAKRELIPAIQGLADSSRFTLLTFGNGVKGWNMSLMDATGANKTVATAYLKNLESEGSTPAMAGLEAAFKVPGRQVIFFVSDGQPTDASDAQILQRVAQLNASKQVTIYTIGLGDDQDENFLRQLAQQNGGTYVRK